ncbi:hypothetical protein [Risungbinella massiliensis]|uniref:hypothetical protein n=1 Tax=Risungbinella massiliensis TaxID=1329796 RepID=UPI0005CB85C6|nr:hypothetical protein [Risungbinella massiliensis]
MMEDMNGVILIGHKEVFTLDLIRKWTHPEQTDYFDLKALNQITVYFGDGQFYYLESPNFVEEFDPGELDVIGIPVEEMNFILLNYDTYSRLKKVLLANEGMIPEGIWLDNDRGLLKPIGDFITKWKENPKWKW